MVERLIYVADEVPQRPPLARGTRFVALRTPRAALRVLAAIARRHGLVGTIRCLAKLATPRRRYYAVVQGRAIVSDGWILIGMCRAYEIGRDSCVIGPIYTEPAVRGQGLATAALSRAVRWCLEDGLSAVYIDTTSTNVASQRVITASGFHVIASP